MTLIGDHEQLIDIVTQSAHCQSVLHQILNQTLHWRETTSSLSQTILDWDKQWNCQLPHHSHGTDYRASDRPLVFLLYKIIAVVVIHYNDIIVSVMASQITSLTIVYLTVYSGTDQIKHQNSTSLAFMRGFPTQKPSNTQNISIWWSQYQKQKYLLFITITKNTYMNETYALPANWLEYMPYISVKLIKSWESILIWKHFYLVLKVLQFVFIHQMNDFHLILHVIEEAVESDTYSEAWQLQRHGWILRLENWRD